ncbi:hypothetical protein FOB71_09060 [Vibrio vulnificus]|nr:hypothetical protein AOT11_12885 [Vibrio vulnificus NBRC 15645 = ATCC 27562]QET75150.1 hypothetical protein FOB71_09060 [Vibrio vulnificus]HAS8438558.1 hypothetical protein [Vibrio vulnificus]
MHGNDGWWCDQFSHSVILTNVGIHPSAPAITNVDHNNPSNLLTFTFPKNKKTNTLSSVGLETKALKLS